MLYIILIIIATFVYLIYKRQKPEVRSDEELMYIEHGVENVENWEKILLERIKIRKNTIQEKIDQGNKNFDLEDWISALHRLEEGITGFNCGKKNFTRLKERFKYDKLKLIEITKDRCDYLNAHAYLFYDSPLLEFGTNEDVKKIHERGNAYFIKMQEIEKRFKDLLGDEYIDSKKLLKIK